jgi:coatomer subunit zeta
MKPWRPSSSKHLINFRPQVDKKAILDEFDTVALILDEAIDEGIILEADSAGLISKVAKRFDLQGGSTPLPEPSLSGAFKFAKDTFVSKILKN